MMRKITVSVTIKFIDMQMDSTDAALEVVRSVMEEHGKLFKEEIKHAIEESGASNVTVGMVAY